MSSTIAIEPFTDGTPRFIPTSPQRESDAPQDDVTPVAAAFTPPALRSAFELFSANLDPVHSSEVIRVVVSATGQQLVNFSHTALKNVLFVVNVEPRSVDPEEISRGSADPVSTFLRIADELGLSQREMFTATGIRKRTFHSWRGKSAATRPRLSSAKELWRLADTIEELRSIVDRPLGEWLNASRERRSALLERRWDDLIDLAIGVQKRESKEIGDVRFAGVGGDVEMPIVRSAERPTPRVVRRGQHP
ncbi:MAG: hypothetical protein ACTHNQ_05215 [Microbacterium sp.]|uniref:hypothetical protein n=1 Tax=Microbacterium sp. TaxID=51671 RepID=UPI003F7F567D